MEVFKKPAVFNLYKRPRYLGVFILFSMLFLFSDRMAYSATNQFGETGLLSISTAETVGKGNVCIGVWCNVSFLKTEGTNTITPLSFTYGMTKNTEIFASHPNIYRNDDIDESGQNHMRMGFKTRLFGTNSSRYKLSISASILESVSTKVSRSGLRDTEGKVLLGAKYGKLKLHFSSGYRTVDNNVNELYELDDEIFAGFAVDYLPHSRFRAFIESEWVSGRIKEGDDTIRVSPGVQIFITPNATFTAGFDYFISDQDRDWRIVAGISSCGGLGEYIVPVPKAQKPEVAQRPIGRPPVVLVPEMVVSRRERMETELIGEAVAMPGGILPSELPVAPVSRYEVKLAPGEQEIIPVPMPIPGAAPMPGAAMSPVFSGLEAVKPEKAVPPVLSGLETVKTARVIRKFRIPELTFDYDKWEILPASAMAVNVISEEILREKRASFIKIEGHTDSVGSAVYNKKLSLQRATAVAELMVKKGIAPETLFIEGYGEERPIVSNETQEGRSMNRRVDIIVILPE